jgi:epsin
VREKSKQILDILGDDERIREERQKARKLREKFGQRNATAAGGGASGGGYGNQDSWNTGGGGGGGGSSGSGGYGDGGIYDNDKGYSGRYGGSSRSPRSESPVAAPTFAAMPDDGGKKKIKKKKKKPTGAPEPAAVPAPGK